MSHADAVLEVLAAERRRRDLEPLVDPRRECATYEEHRWSWGIRERECTRCGRVER